MHYSVATDGLVQSAFKPSRDSFYGYGEFHIPVIGEEQELSWIHALSVTGALRYEKYPGIDQIATPKLGLVLAPTEDFAVKASWGRSFKTPTLYQQYVGREAYLFSAADFGTDVPAGSSLFYVSGGNRDLKPEKARSWSTTISVHPSQLQGLKVEASYFNIDFTNRVVQPVAGSLGGILDKPAYADLLTFAPDAGTLDAIAAGSLYGLTNFSDGEYDPSRVVALVDNRYRNVARQTIKGVDLSVSYRLDLADQQSLSFSGFGSYLQSHQRLTDSLPALQLAGTVFNPPHVRARGGLTWETRKSDISGFASYTGPVDDARPEQKTRVGPALTFDLVGRWNVGGTALAKGGVDITLSILNVLDDRPDTIFTTGPTDTPYDSTNYSPIGRFVALALSKRW
jgi:outer membrane receptor protein involved in Fe transport